MTEYIHTCCFGERINLTVGANAGSGRQPTAAGSGTTGMHLRSATLGPGRRNLRIPVLPSDAGDCEDRMVANACYNMWSARVDWSMG